VEVAMKTKKLKEIITSKGLRFLMEAHNGLSAKIVEEAGFEGIWGSGLSISAAMGVRDNNEATWTQVLEVVEFMSDRTTIPILLDGDTGYGDFNTLRRVVKKLEQRSIAGICIEDKQFPKTNSFIDSDRQELASIDEFCGKIKAAKDTQQDEDFCVVARVEAFIAGWGLGEALKRADAYHRAGADAILIHSKKSQPDQIVSFMQEWGDTCPVVIVPTKYYSTPTEVFRELGVSVVIWANHILRSSVLAMQKTAKQIFEERAIISVEDRVVTVAEVFRLQGAAELSEAENKYLPSKARATNVIVLAASRGDELAELTDEIPKAMLPIQGKPLLEHQVAAFNANGVKDLTVVRGYRGETIRLSGADFIDNEQYADTKEVYSLWLAKGRIKDSTIICFGDILFKKYICTELLEDQREICLVVDATRKPDPEAGGYLDLVFCDQPFSYFQREARLTKMGQHQAGERLDGEWIGMFKVQGEGGAILSQVLAELSEQKGFESLRMADLFNHLVENGQEVGVLYVQGHWLDLDDLQDFSEASLF
jgi:phosphoenolpyruvate phosphomutase